MKEFKKLIKQRLIYLKGLKKLENWINGNSFPPNDFSIKISTFILQTLLDKVQQNILPIPKLVMSPIPCGGISTELIYEKVFFLITVYNREKLEVECCKDGNYFDLFSVNTENLFEKIQNILK